MNEIEYLCNKCGNNVINHLKYHQKNTIDRAIMNKYASDMSRRQNDKNCQIMIFLISVSKKRKDNYFTLK